MPHLAAAAAPASSAGAVRPGGAGSAAVAFPRRRLWASAGSGPSSPRMNLRARGVRREDARGGGGAHAATAEQEREQLRQATPPTFYELLGVSSQDSTDEVRAAYRRMALRYHPDVAPPGAAAENTRRFIEVQEAYETLSDPSRRDSYDRALARGVCRLAFSGPRSGRAYHHHHQDYEDKSEWRRSWQDQVAELKRRSMTKDSEEDLSWGAKMRRKRAES